MKNLLHHIISLGILTPSFPGKVINQLSKFLTTECTSNWDTFIGCDWSNKHQDYFYSKDINITKHPNLASVIKLVLTLSHEGHQLKGYHHQQYINRLQCWKAHFERLHALNAQIASNLKVIFKSAHQKYQLHSRQSGGKSVGVSRRSKSHHFVWNWRCKILNNSPY